MVASLLSLHRLNHADNLFANRIGQPRYEYVQDFFSVFSQSQRNPFYRLKSASPKPSIQAVLFLPRSYGLHTPYQSPIPSDTRVLFSDTPCTGKPCSLAVLLSAFLRVSFPLKPAHCKAPPHTNNTLHGLFGYLSDSES